MSQCGRFPLGEKGVGRLGVHKLGKKITLYSKGLTIKKLSCRLIGPSWKARKILVILM